MTNNDIIPRPTGFLKRFLSLFVLIALSVSLGSWYFFKEQRINVLRDTEVLLWVDARRTINKIEIWYAAIKIYGTNAASSEQLRAFVSALSVSPYPD